MKTGDKIRILRNLKGFSQENMADMVGISRQAYGEIERGNTEPSAERLAQIAQQLGLAPQDIEGFGNAVSNFFDQCNGATGINTGTQNNHYDQRELLHQLEKLQLELRLCQAEKAKAELELTALKNKG
jgi:transcriptional regulator with XRE-family HTH domain